jgi:hypothetical protein
VVKLVNTGCLSRPALVLKGSSPFLNKRDPNIPHLNKKIKLNMNKSKLEGL